MGTSENSRMKILRVALVTVLLFAIGTVTPTVVAAKRVTTTPPCLVSSGKWMNSALPQAQTGTFRLAFDATPSSTSIDGVVGLSSGPASNFTNLAAIVRFNPNGTIDARNGAAYTAATSIAYSAGTTYHFILDVNVAAHTYNASVVVNGAQLAIGTKLAFRSEQSGVSSLNNVGSMTAPGSQTICNVAVSGVTPSITTPSITTQPLSQAVTAGQAATFSVAAVGTAPMSYQWQKNGAAISGATSSTYQTPVTTLSDNGSQFTVVTRNSAGSVTSSGATLTVKAPVVAPSITSQPLSQTVTAGQSATFSVAGTGTPPVTYQWLENGAAISGATSSTYQTPATTVSDSGSQFTVVMSNSAGSVTSSGATLTVKAPVVALSITAQPLSQTVTAGQAATFSVAAAGTAPMSYQWQKNGASISGATSSTYQTPVTTVSDNASQFTVLVTNTAGSATSSGATLTVNAPAVAPSITTQPLSQTVTAGQSATFSVAGTGTAPVTYQWQENGAAISGATSSTYQTPVTTLSDDASQFTVVVSNSAGSVTSNPATLTVTSSACMPSSGSWVNSTLPQVETGTFRLEFDATPASAPIDGVVGLSSGPASDFTNLAAIVRFNTSGTIDARNGAAYTAATSIAYSAGTTYHFILDVNVSAHTYNASVVINGAAVVIGTQLAFRTEQAGVSSLNNVGSMTAPGSQTICNITVTVTPPACVSSSGSWVNSALPQTETGTFRLEFDAMPASAPIDGVVGLSSGPASDFTNLAAIIRFNPAGTIDARNGAAYTAATSIAYSAGTTYHFILDVNVSANTYNASVVINGAPTVIGTQLAFRTDQAGVSSLNNVGSMTAPGSQTICNVAVSGVTPSITTQPLSQTVTPGQAATFSVAAVGTAPMSYQWQKNGTAISGATSSTYQTPATTLSDNGSQFTVVVTNSAGNVTSSSGTLTVSMGTVLLSASSTQLSFGSVAVSSDGVQSVTVTNSGSSNVTISNVAVSGAGFNASGGVAGLILSPGQTASVGVTFAPAAAGTATGSVTITSNATNSPAKITLTGTGVAQTHAVNLSWSPSTSSVVGYNVYSSRVSGGPYSKLNATPMAPTSYTDATVQPGLTYFYVTTAVGSGSGNPESGFSAEVSAVVP